MIFEYVRKVNFYETDAQGVVHHSNYPRFFEEARGYYLEQIGYPYPKLREELKVDVVLLSLFVEYLKPLKFGDIFSIKYSLVESDSYFFKFRYDIFVENDLCAVGETKHCCISRDTRKVIKIPKELKERMK
ncbi:thioesterase family protein [Sulfurihydrogenibium sp.]|uniref:acyl-CoA thioesterase n=1 Tax=Sulfurihydrogenibium sp. TaxID=2053621 RepID=UPI0026219B5E|nr:thioesterase family protein [Sulfurihydrogenibium sp.]